MNNWSNDNTTTVSLKMGDTVHTWTTVAPCNDVPINELIQAFYSELIGFTYNPDDVADAFISFGNEHKIIIDNEEE